MTESSYTVPGASAPVTIRIDQWGIPHIKAESQADAFFAQGWNAARDRLWQIDLWRKRGLGLLSGDFGPAYAAKDEAARLFLYRGPMKPEWQSYGPNAQAWTEAFVAGINAYIDGAEAGEHQLPPEFALMGTRPARWQAEDVVRIRSHARVNNVDQEIRRSAVLAKYGAEADSLRPSAARRGYDHRWREIRLAHLRREPACRNCGAGTQLEVDHIDGDSSHNTPGNLRTLCHSCHSRRTARDQGFARRMPRAVR